MAGNVPPIPCGKTPKRSALVPEMGPLALVFTALVASLDEWHQSYIPSRTGTWHDVLLDSTAALVALILIRFWIARRTGNRMP